MNDTLKMYGSIRSDIMNRYFVVAMCFKRQPRWRRLQTINSQQHSWATYALREKCLKFFFDRFHCEGAMNV